MSTCRVVCSNGVTREGRICDRYPGGRVEVEDDDGKRWTGRRLLDEGTAVGASYEPINRKAQR